MNPSKTRLPLSWSQNSITFPYTHLFWNCSFSNSFLNYRVELSLFFSTPVKKDERVYERNYYTYSFLKEVKPQEETKDEFSFINLSLLFITFPQTSTYFFLLFPFSWRKERDWIRLNLMELFDFFSSKESRLRILLFQPLCLSLVFFLHSAILLLSFTLYLTNLSFLYSSRSSWTSSPLMILHSSPFGRALSLVRPLLGVSPLRSSPLYLRLL